MDWFAAIGMVTGVGGCTVAGWGLRQAQLSRRLAEGANQAADKSVAAAERANQIAEEANVLSGKAVTAVTEQHFVEWQPSWDERACELRVYNRGADDARDVKLIVLADDEQVIDAPNGPVAPRGWVGLNLPIVDQKRDAHERSAWAVNRAGGGVIVVRGGFSMTLRVTVTWRSEAGLPKAQAFDLPVT